MVVAVVAENMAPLPHRKPAGKRPSPLKAAPISPMATRNQTLTAKKPIAIPLIHPAFGLIVLVATGQVAVAEDEGVPGAVVAAEGPVIADPVAAVVAIAPKKAFPHKRAWTMHRDEPRW